MANDKGMKELQWTGERLTTVVSDMHVSVEHLHRYTFALQAASGLDVLDIASGEGYGANLLADIAKSVIGVDSSSEAVEHAQKKYLKPNLVFKIGTANAIPLADRSVDLVVSFETIEHHDKHEEMIQEIKRVLRPGGHLILSTPDKSIYWQRDASNPFHIKEISKDETVKLLIGYFKNVEVVEQRFVYGSLISKSDSKGIQFFNGNYKDVTSGLSKDSFYNNAFFNIFICTDVPFLDICQGASFYDGLNVMKRQFDDVNSIRKSKRYQLGNIILTPFSWFKIILLKIKLFIIVIGIFIS